MVKLSSVVLRAQCGKSLWSWEGFRPFHFLFTFCYLGSDFKIIVKVKMRCADGAKILHRSSSKSGPFCIWTSVLGAIKGWSGMFSHLHRISDNNSVVTIRSWSRLVQVFQISQFKAVGRVLLVPNLLHFRAMEASSFFGRLHIWPLLWPPQVFVFPNQVPLIQFPKDGLQISLVFFKWNANFQMSQVIFQHSLISVFCPFYKPVCQI